MKKKVANGPNLNRPTAAARHTTSKASGTCITGGTAVGCRDPLAKIASQPQERNARAK